MNKVKYKNINKKIQIKNTKLKSDKMKKVDRQDNVSSSSLIDNPLFGQDSQQVPLRAKRN